METLLIQNTALFFLSFFSYIYRSSSSSDGNLGLILIWRLRTLILSMKFHLNYTCSQDHHFVSEVVNWVISSEKKATTWHQKMKTSSSRQMDLSRQTSRASYIMKKYESYNDRVLLLSPFNNFTCRELGVQLNNTVNFFSSFYCLKLLKFQLSSFWYADKDKWKAL